MEISFGYFGLMLAEKNVFELYSKRLITFLIYTRLYRKFRYFDFLGADFGFWGPISYIFGVGFNQKRV